MSTYDKSTYEQLIDDIRSDINENADLSRKSDESFQVDILRAEQLICDKYDITEEYELRLAQDVDEYSFRDRSPIEGVTNASPISVRSKLTHGLSDKDIITVRGVQGNDAANGAFRIGLTDTFNFTLKEFARITGVSNVGTTVTATTEKAHGWTTGYTVTIDGSAAYIDGTFVITVTGVKNFTFTHTIPSGTYNGLGVAFRNSTGSGAYLSGGRFWKENEIPSHLGRFDYGEGLLNGIPHRVDFVENSEIVDAEGWDWSDYVFGTFAPSQAAHGRKNGRRYLRFFPMPSAIESIRLYGILKITPTLYYADALGSEIHLDAEWNEAIKSYVKSNAYKFLKDKNSEAEEMANFTNAIRQRKLNTVSHTTMRVVYS